MNSLKNDDDNCSNQTDKSSYETMPNNDKLVTVNYQNLNDFNNNNKVNKKDSGNFLSTNRHDAIERRRPSIFDNLNVEESNNLLLNSMTNNNSNMLIAENNQYKSFKSTLSADNFSISQIPLLQISFASDDPEIDRADSIILNDSQMETSREDEDYDNNKIMTKDKNPRSTNEKRVEFSIGPKTPPKINKSRPKSVLKRFNIDTHSLMSQNVDESEEYELLDKDRKPTSSLITNLDQISTNEKENNCEYTNKNDSNSKTAIIIGNKKAKSSCELKLKNSRSTDETELSAVSSLTNNKLNSGYNNEKQMLSSNQPNHSNNESPPYNDNCRTSSITGDRSSHKSKKSKFQKKIITGRNSSTKAEHISQSHEIFVELEQLHLVEDENGNDEPTYEWREISRWIKYEQTIDPETQMWSKPYVGALVHQSLLYLKTGLQYGTVILKCHHESFPDVIDEMIHDFVDSGHMNKENRELVKRTILSQHRHNNSLGNSGMRKKSTISDFFPYSGRRQSTYTNDHAFISENNSNATSRKNSSIQCSDLNISNKHRSGEKLSMSEMNLENKTGERAKFLNINNTSSNLANQRENSVKFYMPAPASQENHSSSIENNLNNHPANQKRRRSTIAILKSTLGQSKLNKSELSIKGVSSDAEAFIVMVGVVDYLDRPVMGFVRLNKSQIIGNHFNLDMHIENIFKSQNQSHIDDLSENQIKVKFIFVLLGPKNENIDYLEIGRCIGTLMTNREFNECAYRANDRRELIEGITNFTNRSLCLVLPNGNFDDDLLIPIIEWIRLKMKKKMGKFTSDTKIYDKSLPNTHKNKKLSNNSKDIMSTMSNYSNNSENSNNNFSNGSNGGNNNHRGSTSNAKDQNDSAYTENEQEDEEYDPFQRTGYLFGSLIKEIKYRYSKYLSDFKDALNIHCLIAFVFIFTVCIAPALSFGGILADKTNKWFGVNEMLIATSMNGIISGLFSGQPLMILGPTGPFLVFEEMLYLFCKRFFCLEFLAVRCWVAMWVLIFTLVMLACESVYIINYVTRFTEEIFAFLIASVFLTDAVKKIVKIFMIDPIYSTEKYCNYTREYSTMQNYSYFKKEKICAYYGSEEDKTSSDSRHIPHPNIALLSLMLLIGTCVMSLALKKLRRSIFLGAYARRTLSDVGMLISIILMVCVDYLIKQNTSLETQKLDIPDSSLVPTKYRITWFVSPFGSNIDHFPIWVPFAAIFPASLVFIVLFFEIELTGMILYAKHRKLKKGTGFNLDLLIAALLMNLNSLFGLPWMCAAPVRTLAHWASLTVYSKTYVPGEKPKLIDVKEQRLTNICVHLAIGLCLLAKSALKMIPISVLFGIFLYFGIVSLSGTQLYERIKLIFIPSKYCPNVVYARGVRPSKRNLFTLIQIVFVAILLTIKSYNSVSYVFPIFLVLLVPLRIYFLPKVFTNKELEQLDNHDEMIEDSDMALDFYELTHLPI